MLEGTDPNNKPGETKQTPTFDDNQQKFINELFDKRFGKIKGQHEQEKKTLEDQIVALQADLEEAKKADKKPSGEGTDDKTAQEQERQLKELLRNEQNKLKTLQEQMRAKDEEVTSARAESMRIKKDTAIAKAAAKQNFVELDVVMAITGSQIAWDEDSGTFVVKENGVIKQNSSLSPMTLEEFYADFAAKRPYLVNGDVVGGAGSTESARGGGSAAIVKSKADIKTTKEKSEFIAKFGLEKWEALPLK